MDIKHLTEQEVATFAEAMVDNNLEIIPTEKQLHIKECDICNEELVALVDLISMEEPLIKGRNHKLELNSENKTTKNSALYYIWMGIAASIIIGATIILLLSEKDSSIGPRIADDKLFMEEVSIPQDTIVEKEVIVKTSVNKQLNINIPEITEEDELLAFVANEELEKLSERYTTALRSDEVEIVSSNSINTHIGNTVEIQWINDDSQYLVIEIYNNKGELIIEKASVENSYIISPNLDEGLYYWKLINSDFDLLFCGKITINNEKKSAALK